MCEGTELVADSASCAGMDSGKPGVGTRTKVVVVRGRKAVQAASVVVLVAFETAPIPLALGRREVLLKPRLTRGCTGISIANPFDKQ